MASVVRRIFAGKRRNSAPNPRGAYSNDDPETTDKMVVINEASMQLVNKIKEGSRCIVYEGSWESNNGPLQRVAVKTLSKTGDGKVLVQFLEEANVVSTLRHPNIIKIFGVTLSPPRLVMEYAHKGDLLSYLRNNDHIFTAKRLHNYTEQIASAMQYLEEKKLVYRNLATKNILMSSDDHLKLTNFELATVLDEGDTYKSVEPIAEAQVAWSPLEVLQDGIFSTASDVWSYGVTLWEIYSLGSIPYEGLSSTMVIQSLAEKRLLPKPKRCHQQVYNIILWCWKESLNGRPSFNRICSDLSGIQYDEVMAVAGYHVDDDDNDENLHYQQGDRITIIDRSLETWWTGVHMINGKCGYIEANKVRFDTKPLETLKYDIVTNKKRITNISIGSPTNVVHTTHVGSDGNKWYDKPLLPHAFLRSDPVRRTTSVPSSIELITSQDNTDSTGLRNNSELESNSGAKVDTPHSPKVRPPIQPREQSPLTKALHRDPGYVNLDAISAKPQLQQKFNFGSSEAAASCPDIPSRIYYNLPMADSTPLHQHTPSTNGGHTSSFSTLGDANYVQLHPNTTKPQKSQRLAHGAPGAHAYLIDTIKEQLPEVPQDLIVRFVLKNISGDVQQTIKDIKVYHLFMMKLQHITQDDCIASLEHCQWDMHRAADWLINKSTTITKQIV